MSQQKENPKSSASSYEDISTAPMVFFDLCAANGFMNGAIQIELAARTMAPIRGSTEVTSKFITSGRLRCSPTAAAMLRDAIDGALKLLQKSQEGATSTHAAGTHLN